MPVCEAETTYAEIITSSQNNPQAAKESAPAPAAPRPNHRYLWTLAAVLAAACIVAGFLVTHAATARTRIEPMAFGFQAAQRQDRLALTWNPAARAVREATGATLTIQDGPETEDVELRTSALRAGGVLYYPVFQNVTFRLKLANAAHRTVTEQAQLTLRP